MGATSDGPGPAGVQTFSLFKAGRLMAPAGPLSSWPATALRLLGVRLAPVPARVDSLAAFATRLSALFGRWFWLRLLFD
jgi:hypothetical protein